jgi:hypothetical protein
MTATCKLEVQQQTPVNLVGVVARNHLWLPAEAPDFSLSKSSRLALGSSRLLFNGYRRFLSRWQGSGRVNVTTAHFRVMPELMSYRFFAGCFGCRYQCHFSDASYSFVYHKCSLGSTQRVREMSTIDISWGWRWPVPRGDKLTTFTCWLSRNSDSHNLLETYKPVQAML